MAKPMHITDLGSVLLSMSAYARERAEYRKPYLKGGAGELLYALAFTFEAGAKRCIEIAQRDLDESLRD